MSAFTWLDYSERDRRKMLEVVDLFKERETRDELGIGSVRDAFADQLFPGTSTVMTRARYFLFVAWTYQALEKKSVASAQMPGRTRKAEVELIDAVERSDDNLGNIGKFAKTALKRLPSSVYWQGMGVWGIRTFGGAQAQYYRSLDQHYARLKRHGGRTLERDVEHDDIVPSNWHGGLIPPPQDFPGDCSLRLTRGEAEYLSDRIRLSPSCAGSLLAELVGRRKRHDDVDFPWQHPYLTDLPERLREMLLHAQNFSELMHGAALLYNLILAEQAQREELMNDYRGRFAEWSQAMESRFRILSEWSRNEFWRVAHAGNSRISTGTQEFVVGWWNTVLNGSAAHLQDSTEARRLVRNRERRLKKTLSRIDNPRGRERWNGDSGSGQLEFRWGISQRLMADIFEGMEAADA